MTAPSAHEQLMLELTNRFRADPGADFDNMVGVQSNIDGAISFFDVDLAVLADALDDLTAAAPLAWNDNLGDAADFHSQEMIDADAQSHQLPGEVDFVERAENAGYDQMSALGENIFAFTDDMLFGHAGFVVDWGNGPDGMQDPAGHRLNLISSNFTEIGIGVIAENDPATDVGPFVVTQDLGTRFDYEAQLLGVVINDTDNDDFYDIGEGMAGVIVTASGSQGTFTTTTWDSGGWQMEVPAGSYTVTFSGGGLSGSISKSATIGSDNVKVDAEADEAQSSTTPTTGDDILDGTGGADTIRGLKGDDEINGLGGDDDLSGGDGDDDMSGGDGDDDVSGNRGDDVLNGDAGADVLRGSSGDDTLNGGTGNDDLRGGTGLDTLNGGDGADTLSGGGRVDILNGDAGDDLLDGGKANDTLDGGAGADILIGHKGADNLTGGADADTFVFRNGHGTDVVTDFADGTDMIEFVNTGLAFADLTITANGGDALVDYSDGTIELTGVDAALLGAGDFIFS